MAWSTSGLFAQSQIDNHKGTVVINLDLETHKIALFDNTVTPDYDAAAASIAYNTGTWTTGKEVTGTGIAAGGIALTSTTVTDVAGGIEMWDAADSSWTTATGSSIYGAFIYADALTTPVADQGIAAIYFGGAYQVTAGTFTIQWSANGIARIDYAP